MLTKDESGNRQKADAANPGCRATAILGAPLFIILATATVKQCQYFSCACTHNCRLQHTKEKQRLAFGHLQISSRGCRQLKAKC